MLQRLAIRDLRIVGAAELEFAAGLNLLQGANASGKTTVLEAIHLASTGRALRGPSAADAIRRGALQATVQVATPTATLALTLSAESRRITLDGQPATRAELARACPLLIIMPGAQREFFSEAEVRRRVLRWGVFHVEPAYAVAWSRYARALAQRNAALRAGDAATAWALDPLIVGQGEAVRAAEAAFCQTWASQLQRAGVPWSLTYAPSWEGTLEEALAKARQTDRARGLTTVGPHRSDVVLESEGERPAHFASHGQLKMLYLTLRLAQLDMVREHHGEAPLVLIDDLHAELDVAHVGVLLDALRERRAQVVLTAITFDDPGRVDAAFHVEQGVVTRVR